jgi:hypothetical protein
VHFLCRSNRKVSLFWEKRGEHDVVSMTPHIMEEGMMKFNLKKLRKELIKHL